MLSGVTAGLFPPLDPRRSLNSQPFKRRLNGWEFNDLLGSRGGNNPAVTPLSILYQMPAERGVPPLGFFPGIEGPHRLGGIVEGGVTRRDQNLGHHRDHRTPYPMAPQSFRQCLLQQVSDAALGFGDAGVQR